MTASRRILLINLQASPSFWNLERVRSLLGGRPPMCNLALPTLAALVPSGWEVLLCDEQIQDLDRILATGPFDVIGLTGYVSQMRRAVTLLERLREETSAVLVMGGPAVTLDPELVREKVDVLFFGEAERTWPRFLEELEQGTYAREYRDKDPVDLRLAPTPRIDLMPPNAYMTGLVQTGRGCPFSCEFCDIVVMFGRQMRSKMPPAVVRELEGWHQQGYRMTFLADDNFIGNKRQAIAMMEAIRDWQQQRPEEERMALFTQASINLSRDAQLLGLAREANLTEVFVGIESPNASALSGAGKMQNVRTDLLQSVHTLQRHGLIVSAGMIVGFDEDGPGIFEQQLEFLQAAGIPVVMAGQLYALAGTPLAERLEHEGRLLPTISGVKATYNSNFEPKQMSRQTLAEGHWWLVQELYRAENFLPRLQVLLNNLPQEEGRRGVPPAWQLEAMAAVADSFKPLSADARHVRKLLMQAMKNHPRHALSLGQILLYFRDMQKMMAQGPLKALGAWGAQAV